MWCVDTQERMRFSHVQNETKRSRPDPPITSSPVAPGDAKFELLISTFSFSWCETTNWWCFHFIFFLVLHRCRFNVFIPGVAIDSPCSFPPITGRPSVQGSAGQSRSVEVHRREGNRSVPKEANSLFSNFFLCHFDSMNHVKVSCLWLVRWSNLHRFCVLWHKRS